MNYYLTLTTNCNLKCQYCYGKSCEDFGSNFHGLAVDYSLPSSIEYSTSVLRDFLKQDEESVLIFYGGEPLLEINRIREIMDTLPNARFVIQTNGLLLNRLESDYLNRIESIFISLDGDGRLTDHYRGTGTYAKVIDNLQKIRHRGYEGEMVARMTVAEPTEIDTQVLALITGGLPISSVHWQLDALFWQNDYPNRQFMKWAAESYNPRLRKLIHTWVEHMRSAGEVWRLYPFVGVTSSLLDGESSCLRCGAGWNVFNIQTDGNITPCPVMAGMKDFYLGNIDHTHPESLRNRTFVSDPCPSCNIFTICGGRCLYANATKLWGDEGFKEVCGTVSNMTLKLREVLPEIRSLIQDGTIQRKDFDYQKYNGCEIIP